MELVRKVADSLMDRYGLLTDRWSYDYGVVWRGMEELYALSGEQKYFDYIRDAMDTFVGEDGSVRDYDMESYNLDYLCDGRQMWYLWKQTGEEKYRKAAEMLRHQLRGQPRTSDGGFWHKKCYPYQMWLDGLHMGTPFYLTCAKEMGEGNDVIADAAKQLILAYEHTLDEKDGLNRHAWDEKYAQDWADPETGRAAHAWGRAIGWYAVALADSMELIPEDHPDYGKVKEVFRKLAERMMKECRDGAWMQIVDCPEREGNYPESSGTYLMLYAFMKGARLGVLDKGIGDRAAEAYDVSLKHFVYSMKDGRTFVGKCCQGAGLAGTTSATVRTRIICPRTWSRGI